ncbi:MAG: phage tail family protein [Acutalibacter sp.]|nr:phage tail family protein [Acutalibacter sp.]
MLYAIKNDDGIIKFDRQNYVLTSADYGAISATHSTAKGINQMGERVVNTTLDTRAIEIVGFIKAASAEEMERKKAALYQMCDPRTPYIVMPNEKKALECYSTGTVKFSASRLTNNDRVASFVIDANSYDPLFRDDVLQSRKIAEWDSNFIWPLSIPSKGFTFSDRTEGLFTTIENSGTAETGLLLYFRASATVENPSLKNIKTGEFIKLNRTLTAGETVIINTNYGHESAISQYRDTVEDVINSVDLDSTFLQVPVGLTTFQYAADSNVTSMTVTLYFYQKYLGV